MMMYHYGSTKHIKWLKLATFLPAAVTHKSLLLLLVL